ncbi:MAG: NAD(P)-dependent dehydrogenase (short-subunit alcohol dehydrogenase family) [Paracoccaceae bacterium]|jgi:NAD(P)-dependent dehydrogenase (short-subunit alcohol dehydrogenase family)
MRKTLLVTGAAAGIGAATARMAATRGYDLALNYRSDRAGIDAVAADCKAAGARVILCAADVARPEDIDRMFAQIDDEFARLDAMVNNAGVVDQIARVTDLTHDRLRRMFDINVIGAILVAKEAVLRMQKQGTGGAIVNVSSAAARLGSANTFVDYAASKAAIDIFTKGLSDEVAGNNIRVNAVRPGIIDTALHGKAGKPDRVETIGPMAPMKRAGTADEVADAILYLLSDQASYITGTTLDVTGGR